MIIRKPDYYDRFQCIAGECSDSCCIGWEIDVDEERQEEYRISLINQRYFINNCYKRNWNQH